jgi:dimethylaniline monooxygenase (N-oxide forming)
MKPRGHGIGSIVLAWRSARGVDPTLAFWMHGPVGGEGPVLISVTDFHLKHARDLLRVYLEGARLGRGWPSRRGAVGMWLWTKPLRRRSGSVSIWRSEDDLRRFVRWPRHVKIMRHYRGAGELTSTSWWEERFDARQIWSTAATRLAGDDPDLAHARASSKGAVSGSARRVCVIGAGMSGLAAIRGLTLAGHRVTAYEAGSALGGMWRYGNDSGLSAAYASLQTNTSRARMHYPSLPLAESVPEFPHHSDMLAYLESYAQANDLLHHIEFGAWVEEATPVDGCWDVTVRGSEPRRFDALVVAAGHYWDAEMPQLPGKFDGVVTHVRDYRTPDRFSGRRVVVVGASQSALDIAAEISTTAERTFLSCRQGHHLIPRHVFGRPFDEYDNAAALLVPLPFVRLMMRLMMRAGRVTPDSGDIPPPGHELFETRWPVVVSPSVQRAIADRAFESRAGVRRLAGDRVVFSDGSEEEVDAIVFATGYRVNFPFLPEELGRGEGWQFPLYRRVMSPHVQNLAFIGILEPGPGLFEIVERQVTWLGEVLAGHIRLPSGDRMWQAIDAGGEPRSRRQFVATGPHTVLCNRHAYLRTLDRDARDAARMKA